MASLLLPRNSSTGRFLLAAARRSFFAAKCRSLSAAKRRHCTVSGGDGDGCEKRTLQPGERYSASCGIRSGWRLVGEITLDLIGGDDTARMTRRRFTDDEAWDDADPNFDPIEEALKLTDKNIKVNWEP